MEYLKGEEIRSYREMRGEAWQGKRDGPLEVQIKA